MAGKYNIAPGQVYEIVHSKTKVVIGRLDHINAHGDGMWTYAGLGGSSHNVAYFLDKGEMRLYSRNSLNA